MQPANNSSVHITTCTDNQGTPSQSNNTSIQPTTHPSVILSRQYATMMQVSRRYSTFARPIFKNAKRTSQQTRQRPNHVIIGTASSSCVRPYYSHGKHHSLSQRHNNNQQQHASSSQSFFRALSTTTSPTGSSSSSGSSNFHDPAVNEQHGLDLSDPYCNVSEHIASRVGVNLHQRQHHPLCTIKGMIHDYWNNHNTSSSTQKTKDNEEGSSFTLLEDLPAVVTVQQNFDQLRIPPNHVSRQKTDTYYLSPDQVLRCHTSAHQVDLLAQGHKQFLCAGDVYRRDEIDASHYPVFHQMEGVKLFDISNNNNNNNNNNMVSEEDIQADLQKGLEGLAKHLFGADAPVRWVDAYFPFTHPSMELEVYYQDDWLEVLGCGVIHPDILVNAGLDPKQTSGWAFGLGLERLAMVLFQIPDIRLFWTTDDRFISQFEDGKITKFESYSKYPPCLKDMSFWLKGDQKAPKEQEEDSEDCKPLTEEDLFVENDLSELVREVAGDLVETLELIDSFVHPKTGRTSLCYRISYRSMDRSLTNEEIDALQEQVRQLTEDRLGVELR